MDCQQSFGYFIIIRIFKRYWAEISVDIKIADMSLIFLNPLKWAYKTFQPRKSKRFKVTSTSKPQYFIIYFKKLILGFNIS